MAGFFKNIKLYKVGRVIACFLSSPVVQCLHFHHFCSKNNNGRRGKKSSSEINGFFFIFTSLVISRMLLADEIMFLKAQNTWRYLHLKHIKQWRRDIFGCGSHLIKTILRNKFNWRISSDCTKGPTKSKAESTCMEYTASPFYNLRASKSVERRILCSSGTSCDGF